MAWRRFRRRRQPAASSPRIWKNGSRTSLRTRWGPRDGYYAVVRGPYVYFGAGVLQRLRSESTGPGPTSSARSRRRPECCACCRPITVCLVRRSDRPRVGAQLRRRAQRRPRHRHAARVGRRRSKRDGGDEPRHAARLRSAGARHPLGNGVRPGRFTQAATPADIAPTLAYLAGTMLPRAEGRVLREALR